MMFARFRSVQVEYTTPPVEHVPPSSQALIQNALSEIDGLLATGDRRLWDPLLDVRLKLRPSVPVVPGGPS